MVSLLLTDKWLPCVPLMQIICFSMLTTGITTINLNLLYVKGRSDLVLRLEIIKKTLAFAILFVSMFFSIEIMCLGQVLYSFIALYLNTFYTKRILGDSFGKQMKAILPYLLISLVVLAEALAISHFLATHWVSLLVSAVICSVTYLLLNKVFSLYAYQEAGDLLRAKLGKKQNLKTGK